MKICEQMVVLHSTCSVSYLSLWPASLDWLLCTRHVRVGAVQKKKNGSHLFHQGWQPFETWRYKPDSQITPDNPILSCHVLKCLIRVFVWMHLIYLTSVAPLFSFTHKSPALDSAQEVGWVVCALQPPRYAGEAITTGTDIREAPGPCLVLLLCW